MTECVRAYDTVGRYGGEEFLIVVPASDEIGTLGLAERIRSEMEAQPVALDTGEIRITGSLGVAICSDEHPQDLQVLLKLADEALYRAKERGRNRVELSTPGVSPLTLDTVTAPLKSVS
jgi:diguanylate cyclase (GGDEF)-like protein